VSFPFSVFSRHANRSEALGAGDSGAWVVDHLSGELYGHLVASDAFGIGYVVPIQDVFQDIKLRLSLEAVKLPEPKNIQPDSSSKKTGADLLYRLAMDVLSSGQPSTKNQTEIDDLKNSIPSFSLPPTPSSSSSTDRQRPLSPEVRQQSISEDIDSGYSSWSNSPQLSAPFKPLRQ